MFSLRSLLLPAAALCMPAVVSANGLEPQILAALDRHVTPWLKDPVIIEAIRAQNLQTADLNEGQISRLDRQWRDEAENGGGELINGVLDNPLSRFLKERQAESGGLLTEVFVMDGVGLNVGQSAITSDYFQGDEEKWRLTYGAGSEAVFVDVIEFDDSTATFQAQTNLAIADPDTGELIGAITLGFAVEHLF